LKRWRWELLGAGRRESQQLLGEGFLSDRLDLLGVLLLDAMYKRKFLDQAAEA
jgi:hypothetical protein